MKYEYLAILLLITLNAHLVRLDGTRDIEGDYKSYAGSGDTVKLIDEKSKSIIRVFFGKSALISVTDAAFSKYSPDVIEKMAKAIDDGEREMRSQNVKVNTFIYDNELKKAGISVIPGVLKTPDYDVVLKTIDLIAPDCLVDLTINQYKTELNQFYENKPELAKELLMIIHTELSQLILDTKRAIVHLRHFYYHWISLSSLADYIEKNATD